MQLDEFLKDTKKLFHFLIKIDIINMLKSVVFKFVYK